ncbi:hypothetical protein [Exiguobacterium sp. s193]|uniref:hypothetical protein n=1 Tax=Exiguobacterium sp. s193 TaxID=2751207 RepID=UPI001BE7385B|nr:hypothetical protein [Exiguobacterium sp. s193]
MHFDQALHLLQKIGPEMDKRGLRIATRFYDRIERDYSQELQQMGQQDVHLENRELRILRLSQLLRHVTSQQESSELFKLVLLDEINQTKSFIMSYPEIVTDEILDAIQTEFSLESSDPLLEAWKIVHHQLVDTCRHFCKYSSRDDWRQLEVLLIAETHHLGAVIDEARYALTNQRKTTLVHLNDREAVSTKMTRTLEGLIQKGLIFHTLHQNSADEGTTEFLEMIASDDPIVFVSGSSRFIADVQRILEPLPVIFGPFIADNALPS